jgi:hypothetical protein
MARKYIHATAKNMVDFASENTSRIALESFTKSGELGQNAIELP